MALQLSGAPAVSGNWSPIALGCEPLGGTDWGTLDDRAAIEAVRCALDCGITVFDTADVYGLGRGESALASALGPDRHRVTIVTKGGVRWGSGAGGRASTWSDASPAYLDAAIDSSRRRLRLDTIPVYLVHRPDPRTPLLATLECLVRARDAGRIGAFGLSNFDLPASQMVAGTISTVERELSLLSPQRIVDELTAIRALGLATLTYGPLAQGLLTGKYDRASVFETSDRRHRLLHFAPEAVAAREPLLDELRQSAAELGRSPAQVAIRWVLESKAATSVIVGAKSPQQVRDNVECLAWSLDPEHRRRLAAARQDAAIE